MSLKHKWVYCEHCDEPTVICKCCNNNCCNGNIKCDKCESAYQLQDSMIDCPKKFIKRSKRTHEIYKMNLIEVKQELQKKLTLEEVEILLNQFLHLTEL